MIASPLAQPLVRPTAMLLGFAFIGGGGIPANAVLVNGMPILVNGLCLICTSNY